ncbi:MAG: class I SAM-dependent methyltransferase [Deltaproteobacteria bacterium]|nr:class I SAM-dependent methyltransferase [Deltaproteobacteria bacterium]
MKQSKNPWLTVSPEDYEGHMNSPGVNQLSFLADCVGNALAQYRPSEVAIIGCGTGNGLAHVDNAYTKRTTVVDIHPAYLSVLTQRYAAQIAGLEVVCADLNHCVLDEDAYSLIFAGLVFEFLDPELLMDKISRWLRHRAVLSVVLQMRSEGLPSVSDSGYDSLKRLGPIVNLIDVPRFRNICQQRHLFETDSCIHVLPSGKSFYVGTYQKE